MFNLSVTKMRFLVLVCLLGSIFTCIFFLPAYTRSSNTPAYLKVHFLDVGQGDAIFIETPDKVQVLIDGGPDGAVLRELGEVMSAFDKNIDIVLATHNDKDHIGGLIDVLARYQVAAVFKTNNQHDTGVADKFVRQVEMEKSLVLEPKAGERYLIGASTLLLFFLQLEMLETTKATLLHLW